MSGDRTQSILQHFGVAHLSEEEGHAKKVVATSQIGSGGHDQATIPMAHNIFVGSASLDYSPYAERGVQLIPLIHGHLFANTECILGLAI